MLNIASSTLVFLWLASLAKGFHPQFHPSSRRQCKSCSSHSTPLPWALTAKKKGGPYEDGEVGKGPNWIEKSLPVATNEKISVKKVDDYNLGISGESFQTGPLGKRMFEAIMSRTELEMSDEICQAFTLYAMDFTAKEAARAALTQNGLDMVLLEEEEDQGMWGDVEAVRLYDEKTGIAFSILYDSLDEAVQNWAPGQPFDFVARQVPAKIRELSVEELVQALDPKGELREEAKGLKEDTTPDEESLLSIFDDTNIVSLADMANDNVRRTESAPRGATVEGEAFAGGESRGYRVIKRSDLLQDSINPDGSESRNTLMHVMDALVSHGVVLVDLTDGGTSFKDAQAMADMWETAEHFFDQVADESVAETLPGMTTVMETGSAHAKAGYASYDNGSLKFLETRTERETGALLPKEAREILKEDGISAMKSAFDIVAQVGKDVVRIATAASSAEHGAFSSPSGDDDRDQRIQASQAATLMIMELVDDGKALGDAKIEHSEGTVGMSPHRLCRYSDEKENTTVAREVFGAHTDSSFVTAVPVAAISGLEVYDEEAEKWYRPELKARAHWEQEQTSRGKDSAALVDEIEEGVQLPWHARYVALMGGEHLQLATRDEIQSTVHRVVAVKDGPARVSAPILLRGRPGTKFLADRYLGGALGNPLLEECDGKSMEEIHDAAQPSSYQ